MHAHVPLHGDDQAFDRLQQTEGETHHEGQPQQRMHPVWRRERSLDIQHQRQHEMADQDDHEIGREVVRAMITERLAAFLAMVGNLHEGAEEVTFPAGGTPAAQAADEPAVGDFRGALPLSPRHFPRIYAYKLPSIQ